MAVPEDRTDSWFPVFKGSLVDKGSCVELTGVLRPNRAAWFYVTFPFALLAIGLYPAAQMRWQIVAIAALCAGVFWGLGWALDRRKNADRRLAILALLASAVGSHV